MSLRTAFIIGLVDRHIKMDGHLRLLRMSIDVLGTYDSFRDDECPAASFVEFIKLFSADEGESDVLLEGQPVVDDLLYLVHSGTLATAAQILELADICRSGALSSPLMLNALAINLDNRPTDSEFTVREHLERDIDGVQTSHHQLRRLYYSLSVR